MEATLAAAAPADLAAPSAPPSLFARLQALPLRSRLMLGLGTLGLAVLLAWGLLSGRDPEYRILYASLNDKDGGAVIAALSQLNIPHKFTEGGGALMVPADKVHEARLKLASQGLPKGGTVGFELMENQKFGVTQFQERLNFQRGLEGELARSIMALSAVQSARVHLALPQQTAFLREQQKPSASVLLTLYTGRSLDRAQIAGIVHLVASSVPDLLTKSVSVVDQNGTLLSNLPGEAPNGLDSQQQSHVRATEQNLSQRILAIVEPIVGTGNVKAQVTADIDFTQSESTAELYGPNQGAAPAAVRSQQLSEAPGNAAATGGVGVGGSPGALSNQPPASPTSPVNGAPQAINQGAVSGAAAAGVKRDAVTNYEVDKTVKVVRSATGTVRRLSAAVIVNHMTTAAADGKAVTRALTPVQMEQINALVREAIGFSRDRGDTVQVVNAPFTQVIPTVEPELPLWRQPETVELAKGLGPWLALPLVALMILLGLVRPAMKVARQPALPPRLLQATVQDAIPLDEVGAAAAADGGTTTTLSVAEGGVPLLQTADAAAQSAREMQLNRIRELARTNPATVANVVRSWVNQPT